MCVVYSVQMGGGRTMQETMHDEISLLPFVFTVSQCIIKKLLFLPFICSKCSCSLTAFFSNMDFIPHNSPHQFIQQITLKYFFKLCISNLDWGRCSQKNRIRWRRARSKNSVPTPNSLHSKPPGVAARARAFCTARALAPARTSGCMYILVKLYTGYLVSH